MPNLLVILESKYTYLGGNNVRVVCERVKKFKSMCIGGFLRVTRDWQLAKNATLVKHVES